MGGRLACAGGLLLGEGLLLGICFDADALRSLPAGWWVHVLGAMPVAVHVSLMVCTAGLLLASPALAELFAGASTSSTRRRGRLFLAAHLCAFAGLFAVTERLLGSSNAGLAHPGWWAAAWLFLSAVAIGLIGAAALPAGVTRAVVGRVGGLLALGAVVGCMAWAAGQITQGWWRGLRHFTLAGAFYLLRVVDPAAHVDWQRHLIGSGNFAVEISSQCSGFEGMGMLWVFLAAYFWFFHAHLRFPNVFLLVPVATAAILGVNVLRIAGLVAVGAHVSPEIALGGFHSYAGLVLFCAVALGAAGVAHHSPAFAYGARSHAETKVSSAAPWLVPFLAIVAVALVTAMFHGAGPDPLYGLRVAAAGAVLWHYRASYRGLGWRLTGLPVLAGALVFVIWVALARRPLNAAQHQALVHSFGAEWLIIRSIGFVLVIPFAEELAFRGYLARRLMRAEFDAVPMTELSDTAILVSSLLFGLLHTQFVAGTVAGLTYGWIARRGGRLADAILAHVATNALLTGYILVRSAWWLWG